MILIFWHSEDFKNVKACHNNSYHPLHIYIYIMLKLIGTSIQLLARPYIVTSIFLGFTFHNFCFLYIFILKCYFLLSLVSSVKTLSCGVFLLLHWLSGSFTLSLFILNPPLNQLILFSCSQIPSLAFHPTVLVFLLLTKLAFSFQLLLHIPNMCTHKTWSNLFPHHTDWKMTDRVLLLCVCVVFFFFFKPVAKKPLDTT